MKTKKNGIGGIIGWGFLMILFLFLEVVFFVSEYEQLFGDYRDFYEAIEEDGAPQEGEYVTLDVDAVVDWYAETQYKINGIIPAGKKQHCLVWLDDGSFISLTVRGKKNIEKIDDIVDQTYTYLIGASDSLPESVTLKGKITSISGDISQYYRDALNAWDISAADGLTIYYLDVDTTSTKLTTWLLLGFCLVMAILFAVLMVNGIKNRKKSKLAAQTGNVGNYGMGGNGIGGYSAGGYPTDGNNNNGNGGML